MKKLFITLTICICVVIIVTIATRTDLFNKKTTTNIAKKDYDIYKMLEDVKNISDIYVECELSDGTTTKIYIKDNMKKIISDDTIAIYDIQNNLTTSYKTTDNKGIIFNSKIEISTDYTASCEYLLNKKDELEYEIKNEKVNNVDCIKVIFKSIKSKKIISVIWFELENNFIVKTQGDENENVYTEYKNIKLNCVTNEDFKIPSNVKLTKLEIN